MAANAINPYTSTSSITLGQTNVAATTVTIASGTTNALLVNGNATVTGTASFKDGNAYIQNLTTGGFIQMIGPGSAGAINGIVQTNDAVMLYTGTGAAGTGALCIAPYIGSGSSGGIRMDSTGSVTITGKTISTNYRLDESFAAILLGSEGGPGRSAGARS